MRQVVRSVIYWVIMAATVAAFLAAQVGVIALVSYMYKVLAAYLPSVAAATLVCLFVGLLLYFISFLSRTLTGPAVIASDSDSEVSS